MDATWYQHLRELRETEGLTQRELGERAGVSEASVRAYETGRRHPRGETLSALLRALGTEPIARIRILEGAGFAPQGGVVGEAPIGPDYSIEEASAEIHSYPWPAHLNNEMFEVLDANSLMQAVWGVDFAIERVAVAVRVLDLGGWGR